MSKLLIFIISIVFLNSCMNNNIFEKSLAETGLTSNNSQSNEDPLPSNYDWKSDSIWLIGGSDGTNVLNTIDIYDPYKNEWHPSSSNGIANISTAVRNMSCAAYNNKIYVFGGINSAGNVVAANHLQVYDIATNTWANISNALGARQGHRVVLANDGNIYIIAGSTTNLAGGGVLTISRFRPSDSNWVATGGSIVSTNLDFGAINLDGELLYAGGRRTAGAAWVIPNNVSSYWPLTNINLAGIGSLKVARFGLASAVYSQGAIKYGFFVGGTTTTHTSQFPGTLTPVTNFDIYIPYSEYGIRIVRYGSPLLQARAYAEAVVKGSFLYVFGGASGIANILDSVERIKASDPINNSWTNRTTMPKKRYGFCAVSIR